MHTNLGVVYGTAKHISLVTAMFVTCQKYVLFVKKNKNPGSDKVIGLLLLRVLLVVRYPK